MSLDWQFINSRSGGYQRARYRGLILEAQQDSDAGNPFEDWEGEPDLVALHDDRLAQYGTGDPLNPLGAISDALLRRHLRAIAQAVDLCPAELDKEARETQRDYGGGLTEIKRDAIADALADMRKAERLEACAALWAIAGREALSTSTRGYSQGDYADLLIVATQQWEKLTGAPRDSHARQLKAAAKLYGYWVWGECYGFIIKAPDGSDLPGDQLDSCWGFYGSEHDESGLEEAAMNAADCLVNKARRDRAAKLKELIRNRVPLALRAELLAEAAGELAALFSGHGESCDD